MKTENRDYIGWILNIAIVGLALAAIKTSNDAVTYLAWGILILVFNSIRPGKTLSTARLRIVDSRGAVRGVFGATPQGIEVVIPNLAANYNGATFYSLWHASAAAFTFEGTQTVGGKFQEPYIGIRGVANAKLWSYAMQFDYADEPSIRILERKGSYQDDTDYYASYTLMLRAQVSLNHRQLDET